MESPEVDVKPTIPTGNIPDKSLLAVGISGLKQSRYEDVWPEDVHAAFMEAIALYPPMGKRRLKYYRISTHENEHFSKSNRAKSFGRCQLIQSYILEKTGKNRSRKQVSSHLQRLKKIHKDNPAMRSLFSEHSNPSLDHRSVPQLVPPPMPSPDILANIAFSTRHLKSDFNFTVNVQDADTAANGSPTFSCASEGSFFNGNPCDTLDFSTNIHNKHPITPPQELLSHQRSPASTFRPSNRDFLPEIQDPYPLDDAISRGFRSDSAFNTSAFSISMRRLASRLPIQGRVDSYPTTHLSRAAHTSTFQFQPAHQWTAYDTWMNSASCAPPLTPARQWLHTPFESSYLTPAEKRGLDPITTAEWAWPQNSNIGFGPHDDSFAEISSRYPLTVYHPESTYSETGIKSPVFQSPQSESEGSQLSQGISYSYMATSPAFVCGDSVKSTLDATGQVPSERLASPPVIRPTPVYPVSYIHADHDPHAPTSNLSP